MMTLRLGAAAEPEPLMEALPGSGFEDPLLSPHGRWLAYTPRTRLTTGESTSHPSGESGSGCRDQAGVSPGGGVMGPSCSSRHPRAG
jgi:hypothetical protein